MPRFQKLSHNVCGVLIFLALALAALFPATVFAQDQFSLNKEAQLVFQESDADAEFEFTLEKQTTINIRAASLQLDGSKFSLTNEDAVNEVGTFSPSNNNVIKNLPAGNYTLTISDGTGNNCRNDGECSFIVDIIYNDFPLLFGNSSISNCLDEEELYPQYYPSTDEEQFTDLTTKILVNDDGREYPAFVYACKLNSEAGKWILIENGTSFGSLGIYDSNGNKNLKFQRGNDAYAKYRKVEGKDHYLVVYYRIDYGEGSFSLNYSDYLLPITKIDVSGDVTITADPSKNIYDKLNEVVLQGTYDNNGTSDYLLFTSSKWTTAYDSEKGALIATYDTAYVSDLYKDDDMTYNYYFALTEENEAPTITILPVEDDDVNTTLATLATPYFYSSSSTNSAPINYVVKITLEDDSYSGDIPLKFTIKKSSESTASLKIFDKYMQPLSEEHNLQLGEDSVVITDTMSSYDHPPYYIVINASTNNETEQPFSIEIRDGNEYKIIYNADACPSIMDGLPATYTIYDEYSLTPSGDDCEGLDFLGWWNSSSSSYYPGSQTDGPKSLNLEAKWKATSLTGLAKLANGVDFSDDTDYLVSGVFSDLIPSEIILDGRSYKNAAAYKISLEANGEFNFSVDYFDYYMASIPVILKVYKAADGGSINEEDSLAGKQLLDGYRYSPMDGGDYYLFAFFPESGSGNYYTQINNIRAITSIIPSKLEDDEFVPVTEVAIPFGEDALMNVWRNICFAIDEGCFLPSFYSWSVNETNDTLIYRPNENDLSDYPNYYFADNLQPVKLPLVKNNTYSLTLEDGDGGYNNIDTLGDFSASYNDTVTRENHLFVLNLTKPTFLHINWNNVSDNDSDPQVRLFNEYQVSLFNSQESLLISEGELIQITRKEGSVRLNSGTYYVSVDATSTENGVSLTLSSEKDSTIYNIVYKNLGGVKNTNKTEYHFTDSTFYLDSLNGARVGYKFTGWTDEGKPIDSIFTYLAKDRYITANWESIKYDYTLDLGYEPDGSSSSSTFNQDKYTIESEIAFPIIERTGFAFRGWLDDSTGRVAKGISKGDTGDKTFTASWKESHLSIILTAGDAATVTPSTINVNYGEQVGDLPIPQRPGYVFVEWQLEDGKKYDSKIYLYESGITLYAAWKPIEYVIYLNPSGGSVSPASIKAYNGKEIGTLPTPQLEGFSFAGWFNQNNTERYTYKTLFNSQEQVDTLYAKYLENVPDTATITFNAGEGTVEQINKTVIDGMPLGVLPLPVPNNQLKVFAGWFALVGADSVEWNSATIYNKSGGVTELHAHYADEIYILTFDPQGGYFVLGENGERLSSFEKNVFPNERAGALPVPFKKGFIFNGYKTADSARFSFRSEISSNTTIYAGWIPAYSIVMDPNGGTLPDSVKIVPVGYAAGVLPIPENEGYAFDGWWLNDSTRFFGTEKHDTAAPIYIFANWVRNAPIIHTVRFEPGNGKLDTASLERKVTYGHSLGTLPIPSLAGSRFTGWFTLPQGGAADDDENFEWVATDPYNLSTDLVLFAHYATIEEEENEPLANNAKLFAVGDPITVKLDARNGKDTVVRQGLEGVSIGSLPVPKYDGHEFSGWFTKASGGSEVRSSTKFLTDTTVYAHWYAVPIEVSLKAGEGASVAFDVLYLERGLEVGYIPDPERSGYYFDGWFDSASGGSRYSYATIYKNTSVDTLYAHWTEVPFVVSLNARGGEVNPNTLETRLNSAIGYLPDPNRNRYSFAGWLGGGDSLYYPSTLAQDDSLNAMWLANVPNAKEIYLDAGNGTLAAGKDKWVVAKGYEIGYLPIPSPEDGWNFSGWFDSAYGGSQYTYATIYKNSSIETLYARYIPVPWEIVLNAGEGGSVNPAVVKVARNADSPDDFVAVGILPDAKKAGFAFDGWFKNGAEFNASTQISGNDTLTARYVPQYALYLNRNAPKAYLKDSVKYVVENGKIGSLPTPERSDYMFAGWHTNSVGGDLVTADSIYRSAKDDTLYAHWDTLPPNAYLISFKTQGGAMEHPITKTVLFKREIGELPVPARTDYTFKGWWTNVSGGSQYGESTVYGLEGNIYLFARWEKIGGDPTPIIPAKPPIISGGDGSGDSGNGNSGFAGESAMQATYYDLKGAPLGTLAPTAPGAYIVKIGKAARMIVVR